MDPIVYAAAMEGKREILVNRINQLGQQRTPYKNNIFHILSQYGQAECVNELLENMDSLALLMLLPATNWKNETALHVAAREGHPLIITALIKRATELDMEDPEKGLNIVQQILTSENKDGDTPLHEALRTSIVSPRMDDEDDLETTPPVLRRTSTKGDDESVVVRREQGVTRRIPTLKRIITGDWKQESLRRQVIEAPFLDDVTMLMFPDFPYAANKADETPLYLAAECGCNQLVSKIANNATCNEPSTADYGGPGDRTALHAAIISDNKENTETLFKWCNDLARKPDMRGLSPLHYAAEFGHAERVEQLLGFDKSLGYQMTGEEDGKNTAIHIAARQGHVAVLKKLVSQCAGCWDVVNAKGQNMLHVAVENDKPDVITFFKQSPSLGSLLNRKDIDGNTPLHLAARDSHVLSYFSNKNNSKQQKTNLNNDQLAYCGNGSTEQKKAIRQRLIKAGVLHVTKNSVTVSAKPKKYQTRGAHLDALLDYGLKESYRKYMEKARPTQLVVATLVATATFAAGMTMPGGYNAKEGPHQGVALLLRQAAFKSFVYADVLAMIFSTAAMLLYLTSSLEYNVSVALFQFHVALQSNVQSLILMMAAFIFGSYALLAHLPSLAITTCVITTIVCFVLSSVLVLFSIRLDPLHFLIQSDLTV